MDKKEIYHNLFSRYAVKDVKTFDQFIHRYYKPDRITQEIIDSHRLDFETLGIDWISHYDSVTGQVVSFVG